MENKKVKRGKHLIENKIYPAIIAECESMEAKGMYRGNGHHLAQRLTKMVSEGLLSRQQKKIYEALTRSPQSTKEIAEKVNLRSNVVSMQLKQIKDKTMLILTNQKTKKLKLWYRAN